MGTLFETLCKCCDEVSNAADDQRPGQPLCRITLRSGFRQATYTCVPLSPKAFGRGFCSQNFSVDDSISAGDKKLFRQMSSESHCLHPLLPTQRNNKLTHCLRKRGHNYQLPQIQSIIFKNSFVNRCLFFNI